MVVETIGLLCAGNGQGKAPAIIPSLTYTNGLVVVILSRVNISIAQTEKNPMAQRANQISPWITPSLVIAQPPK
jgi:hypothetical protein